MDRTKCRSSREDQPGQGCAAPEGLGLDAVAHHVAAHPVEAPVGRLDASKGWRFAGHTVGSVGLEGRPEGCERPKRLVNVYTGETMVASCGASSRAVCGHCAKAYRGRVARVFLSGWTDSPGERLYGVTLTAPGDRVHCERHKKCDATGVDCRACSCTPEGGVDLAVWNSFAGRRFSDFVNDLRRHGLADLQYCKGAECQERGALHFHLMMRTRGALTVQVVRKWAKHHGFGHSVDVQLLSVGEAMRAARYCAKYVSKAVDERGSIPWLDRSTGERCDGAPKYRTWSSSRSWGESMRSLKAIQRVYAEARRLAGDGAPFGVSTGSGEGGAAALDLNSECSARSGGEMVPQPFAGADSAM